MITHPEKVLFPDDGITKGELAAYYEAIAPVMLPHIRGRPVTMERYPAGIGEKGFLQKDVSKGFPDWLERVEVPKKDGVVHHPSSPTRDRCCGSTNQNTHHAARLDVARAGSLPSRTSACSISIRRTTIAGAVRAAALGLRDLLEELDAAVVGQDLRLEGLSHRRAARRQDADRRRRAVRARGRRASSSSAHPMRLTQEFSKADRGGRIYVDTGRNGYSATFAAAYTVRAKPRRAGVGAVHVGRSRARRRRAADVHAAEHGRPRREGRRPVGRHATPAAIAEASDGAAREARARADSVARGFSRASPHCGADVRPLVPDASAVE